MADKTDEVMEIFYELLRLDLAESFGICRSKKQEIMSDMTHFADYAMLLWRAGRRGIKRKETAMTCDDIMHDARQLGKTVTTWKAMTARVLWRCI